jgi:hypothetical protein
MAHRPRVVGRFETLSILMLAADLMFASGVDWSDLFWMPMMLWIILSITRRGSRLARWIFTAMYALGACLIAYFVISGLLPLRSMSLAGWVMTIGGMAELGLLWSPAMSQWITFKSSERSALATATV